MRKELFFCSAVLLSATLAGCGYDDGKSAPLMAMPSQCTTNLDCKSGNAIIGDCIQNKCQRFCDIENPQESCEQGSICEAGICRPIISCPDVTLQNAAIGSELQNKSCIQVFSTVPGINWASLLSGDILVDADQARSTADPLDFASEDYSFSIPHEALYTGMNFSVVTLAAITYLRLLLTTATMVAQCTKPEVPVMENNEVRWEPVISNYQYVANYEYQGNDDAMTPDNLMNICSLGISGMPSDMAVYVNALSQQGKSISDIVTAYKQMIENKPQCMYANFLAQILEGVSGVVMEMGMSSTNMSSTLVGAQQVLAWLNSNLDYQTIYNNSLDLFLQQIPVGANNEGILDRLGIYPLEVCDTKVWQENVNKNRQLRDRLLKKYTYDENAFEIGKDENGNYVLTDTIDYTRAKEYVTYCNLEDVAELDTNTSAICDDSNDRCVTIDGKVYNFKDNLAEAAMRKQLLGSVMQSQLHTCIFMMSGMEDFPLMRALASSPDLKFKTCATNEYRVSSMLDVNKLQANEQSRMLLQVLQGLNLSSISLLTQSFVDSISMFADKNVIYQNFTDPTMIWLSSNSLMPIMIQDRSEAFADHDLLFEIVYSSIEDLFKPSTTSNAPLAGPVDMRIVPESYIRKFSDAKYVYKDEYLENPDAQVVDYTKIKDYGAYTTKFPYLAGQNSLSGFGFIHRSSGHGDNKLSCKDCRLYLYAEKQNDNIPMVCGGFTYKTNRINGYVVLTDDDLKNRAGTR